MPPDSSRNPYKVSSGGRCWDIDRQAHRAEGRARRGRISRDRCRRVGTSIDRSPRPPHGIRSMRRGMAGG